VTSRVSREKGKVSFRASNPPPSCLTKGAKTKRNPKKGLKSFNFTKLIMIMIMIIMIMIIIIKTSNMPRFFYN